MGDETISTDPVMTLDEVVKAFQTTREERYFAEIYKRCKTKTFRLCFRLTNCFEEAEDLTQESFLQLHRSIESFRGDCEFTTWFYKIAMNKVLMKLRKKGLRLISMDESMESDDPEESPRQFGYRDLVLTSVSERFALYPAINELTPISRVIFTLHHIDGYSQREVAVLLKRSVPNIKSYLHRARLKLRKSLHEWRKHK